MEKMKRKRRKCILPWGQSKYWTEPASNEDHDIFRFKLDKLRQDTQKKLKEKVITYTRDNYTQEQLQKLARGEKL